MTVDAREVERYKRETLTFLTMSIPLTGAVFYSVDQDLNAIEHHVRLTGSRPRHEHEANNRYQSYFHRLDPFHPRRFADSVVSLVTLRDVIEIREYASSEYYREFFAPLGLLYEAELFLRDRGSIVGGISLVRGRERHDFTPGELGFLRRARPLIECGFTACRRSGEAAGDSTLSEALTSREREIVDLVCAGASNREIGWELHISLPTVKTHLYNIFRKMGIRSRTQLIAALQRRGAA